MDDFEYEEMQWTEHEFTDPWGITEKEWDIARKACEMPYIYDQKFMDTLSYIQSLRETLPF